MTVKDILHEMAHIKSIRDATRGVGGTRAEKLREKAVERSIILFDEIVIYLPVENKNG